MAPFPSFWLSCSHGFAIFLLEQPKEITLLEFYGVFFPAATVEPAERRCGNEETVERCYFNFPLALQQPNLGLRDTRELWILVGLGKN